jgi:hypothetical protein
MATAFQVNAFQNNAFQVDGAVVVVDPGLGNTPGIGAVAEPAGAIDFRKSDKAKKKFEAKRKADAQDRKRAVYEAFYGKPEPEITDEQIAEVVEELEAQSTVLPEFARQHTDLIERNRLLDLKAKHDSEALEILLMLC